MDAKTKLAIVNMLGMMHRQDKYLQAATNRAIEECEKDRAFYLAQRRAIEDRCNEIREIRMLINQCQKD